MAHLARLFGLFIWISVASCTTNAQEIVIVNNKKSEYKIVVPGEPTALEQKSASVFQRCIQDATGVVLPIVKGSIGGPGPGIYIGHTQKGDHEHPAALGQEGYLMLTKGKDLFFLGGSGKGLIYGIYAFLGKYLDVKKIANVPLIVKERSELRIPQINQEGKPSFVYREVYYPSSLDPEFLEWNQLQQFEDLWGLWGHSFDKLVPAKVWFGQHPEYYSLVKGKRQASQLCLSNNDVYKIVVEEFKKRMAANPDALYLSISPNDDNGNCECDQCAATDREQGTAAGSLIKFVNRVAANFPNKKITTLAYGYTHRAPRNLKPAANVVVLLSDIDAYRDKPLATEGSAAGFRNDLKAWSTLTSNIFVWDYVTQFTNYLAPFPNWGSLQANIQYLRTNGVKGMFIQGSGDTYGEMAELRCYLLARLLQEPDADVKAVTKEFLNNYYGAKIAPLMEQYLDLLQVNLAGSGRKLDIYGNPINEWASWLTPELLDRYSAIFDKAEALAEGNPKWEERVMKARLPLEYTVLQQARFYGIEKFGIFEQVAGGKWAVKQCFPQKVSRFVANCTKAGVKEMSEGGPTPTQYQAEWDAIFRNGVTPSVAVGAAVTLATENVADYPAKGPRTLTDGNPGYTDFSYNWMCFYGTPMVATIDLGKPVSFTTVKVNFLDDPRHWIFQPEKVKIEVSDDGVKYRTLSEKATGIPEEHYEVSRKEFIATTSAKGRYLRITGTNLSTLPMWRARDNKKPMIACDEVVVQ